MYCRIFRQIDWNSSLENITFDNANAKEVVQFFCFTYVYFEQKNSQAPLFLATLNGNVKLYAASL